jgi:hypothetical protein
MQAPIIWGVFIFGGRPNPQPLPPFAGTGYQGRGELLPSPRRGGAGGGVCLKTEIQPLSLHHQAAIYRKYLAGDEAGLVGGQKSDGIGHILHAGETTQRRHFDGKGTLLLG